MSKADWFAALPPQARRIGLTVATLAVVSALTAAGDAWGDRSVARCNRPAGAVAARAASGEPDGWRNKTFQAAGCEAWLHLHRHGW